MIDEYKIEIPTGVIADLLCEWLVEHATDTYCITTQEKWNPGKVDWGAQYSHTVLVVRFTCEADALAFKMMWL